MALKTPVIVAHRLDPADHQFDPRTGRPAQLLLGRSTICGG
jgi:hypothetical protein